MRVDPPTWTEKRPPLRRGKTVWPWPRGRLLRYCRGRDWVFKKTKSPPCCGRSVGTHHEEGDEAARADGLHGVGLAVVGAHVVVDVELVVAPVAHHLRPPIVGHMNANANARYIGEGCPVTRWRTSRPQFKRTCRGSTHSGVTPTMSAARPSTERTLASPPLLQPAGHASFGRYRESAGDTAPIPQRGK